MIFGELAKERQIPPAPKVSWLKKLLGHDSPQTSVTSGLVKEVPADDLGKALRRSFREFLDRRIEEPWDATKTALRYIEMKHNTYVRSSKGQNDGDAEWYIQFMFSGCSGMAEVSAELASHWASIWFAERRAEISDKLLKPFGFSSSDKADPWLEELKFLPIGDLGYARFAATKDNHSSEDVESAFEVDPATYEALPEEKANRLLVQLDSQFSQLFENGRCCCQLCSPEMDPSLITRALAEYLN